jgi:hypothetical protein
MDDITRISRMSDCGTVTKRAAALQKWKLKLDEKIEWMRKKKKPYLWGCRSNLYTTARRARVLRCFACHHGDGA